ncbi:MAG: LysR substrate-binding domain-containing protein [Erythrobacter sp.]|nr:LysR substrate-binding domain-containing protein [Erythrobacter sp.]
MNLRDLEYVTAIDRYRNFGRAAESCHVSQPALSAQVKKLEERLGVELFARTNAGVLTTDAGSRIVVTAKDVLRHAQRIVDTAAEYHDPLAAPLRVGIIPTLAPFILPFLTDSVGAVAGALELIYRERPTQALWEELDTRTVDVALISGPVEVTGYNFTPLFREPFMLMVSKNHRLADANMIDASDIPEEEMLLLTREHCLRAEATALCRKESIGIDMDGEILATNFLTMSHYISSGKGCSLVPTLACSVIERANPGTRFVKINDHEYGRDIGFVSRQGCPREKILMKVCEAMRADCPQGLRSLR